MHDMKQIQNPILKGFYPDPSICRVEDDFYMVTSSFAYYPGVPIFHSRDLVNWHQLGHVLDRPSQLPLDCKHISGGIFAPTIRHHHGTFYMITTNVNHGGNFIVTAKDPSGPWSDPYWIKEAEGIDPSLFWDDDGKAYMTGTTNFTREEPPMIWMSEIDLENFRLIGDKKEIWGGALVDCWAPEAPHMYKKDGWYYLMIAEGGTEHHHAVTIARSRMIWGPYKGYEGNPIMTHRHLGWMYPICNTGHGDLVELKDGSWYMVLLASRIYGGYHKNMGRETFIVPVSWEEGWPVASPGNGRVEWTYPAPALEQAEAAEELPARDDFTGGKLGFQWNFLGTPQAELYMLQDSCLKLRTIGASIYPDHQMPARFFDKEEPVGALSFLGRRQQHMRFEVRAHMVFDIQADSETAGIVILQNGFSEIRMEMAMDGGQQVIRVVKGAAVKSGDESNENGSIYEQQICAGVPWNSKSAVLAFQADMQSCSFSVEAEDGTQIKVCEGVDASFLGSETAGGFVGAYIGMFASGNGTDTGNYAAFDWFEYVPGIQTMGKVV